MILKYGKKELNLKKLNFWEKTKKIVQRKPRNFSTKGWDWILPGFNTIQQGIIEDILESENPYVKIWVAHICVDLIAKNIAAIPVSLQNKVGKTIENDPIHQMLFTKPNELQSGNDLVYGAVTYFYVNGNSYIYCSGAPFKILEIWLLNSDHIQPKKGGANEPLIKKYENMKGRDYEPEEICHIKTFNPDSMIVGMSKFKSLQKELQAFSYMNDFQRDSFKNGILPQMHYHSKADIMPDEVYQELRKKISKQLQERFIITYGDMDADPLSFNPNDMGLIANSSHNAAAIATTLGVPAEMLGAIIDKKNVATYKESRKQFYNDTVLPGLFTFLKKFQMYFYPEGDMKLMPILDGIDALRMDFTELLQSWWLTPNQKLEQQGFPRSDNPAMDKIYIPSGFIPIDQLGIDEFPKKL